VNRIVDTRHAATRKRQDDGVLRVMHALIAKRPGPVRAAAIFEHECGCLTMTQVNNALQRLCRAGVIEHDPGLGGRDSEHGWRLVEADHDGE